MANVAALCAGADTAFGRRPEARHRRALSSDLVLGLGADAAGRGRPEAIGSGAGPWPRRGRRPATCLG